MEFCFFGFGATAQDTRTTLPIEKDKSFSRHEKYLEFGAGAAYNSLGQFEVVGEKGLVTGTSGVLGTHIRVDGLQSGSNAIDAMIATSLAQTVKTVGSAINSAAIMTMVYYDAKTDQTYSRNAGYNTVQQELDPLPNPGIDLKTAFLIQPIHASS